MGKVLLAWEFLDKYDRVFFEDMPFCEGVAIEVTAVREAIIEFAKLHVKEALKQASEKALYDFEIEDIIDKNSILNAYDLNQIK